MQPNLVLRRGTRYWHWVFSLGDLDKRFWPMETDLVLRRGIRVWCSLGEAWGKACVFVQLLYFSLSWGIYHWAGAEETAARNKDNYPSAGPVTSERLPDRPVSICRQIIQVEGNLVWGQSSLERHQLTRPCNFCTATRSQTSQYWKL